MPKTDAVLDHPSTAFMPSLTRRRALGVSSLWPHCFHCCDMRARRFFFLPLGDYSAIRPRPLCPTIIVGTESHNTVPSSQPFSHQAISYLPTSLFTVTYTPAILYLPSYPFSQIFPIQIRARSCFTLSLSFLARAYVTSPWH